MDPEERCGSPWKKQSYAIWLFKVLFPTLAGCLLGATSGYSWDPQDITSTEAGVLRGLFTYSRPHRCCIYWTKKWSSELVDLEASEQDKGDWRWILLHFWSLRISLGSEKQERIGPHALGRRPVWQRASVLVLWAKLKQREFSHGGYPHREEVKFLKERKSILIFWAWCQIF